MNLAWPRAITISTRRPTPGSIFKYHMHTLPDEVSGPIGTSTLFAAWNAAIYVAQVEDQRLDAAVRLPGRYLEATDLGAEKARQACGSTTKPFDFAATHLARRRAWEACMTETKYASPGNLKALLSTASVKNSWRGYQLAELRDHFSPGIDVTITFLPGDDYRHNVETAAALRRLGFNPVPHIAAREVRSRDALDDFFGAGARRGRDEPRCGDRWYTSRRWAHSNPVRTSA